MNEQPVEVPCPLCAAAIKTAAIKCRFCGEMLTSQESTTPPPPVGPPPLAKPPTPVSPPPPTVPMDPSGLAPVDSGPSTFKIREDGKNGTVELHADRIIRTRKKTMGKDDIQTIPIKSISGVHHDRKTLGTDLVKLDLGSVSYEWKVAGAEQMVAAIHTRMF